MRRRLLVVGRSCSAGLLLGGCGIPDDTDVVPLRPGPSTGVSSGDDLSPTRNMRADTTDKAAVRRELPAGRGR